MASAAASPDTTPLDLSDSHGHAVRLAVGIGTGAQAALLLTWLFAREPVLLLGVGCSLLWSVINLAMIRLQRENGMVMLGSGALLVSVYATLTDLSAVHQTASVSVILTGVAKQLYEFTKASGRRKNYFPVVVQILEEITGVRVRDREAVE